LRIDLHQADRADVRACRRLELIVFREHHAEHERRRNLTGVRFTDRDIRERARPTLVHLSSAKQIHREELAIEKELWGLERDLRRRMHPRGPHLRRVDVPMLRQLPPYGLAADVHRTGQLDRRHQREERAGSETNLRPNGAAVLTNAEPPSEVYRM